MDEKRKKIFGFPEKLGLAVVAALVVMRLFFWEYLKQHLLISGIIITLAVSTAAGLWIRRNFKLVSQRAKKIKEIQAKLEGILFTMFQPMGYDIMQMPQVDRQEICWALLRDPQGIMVVVHYYEISMGETITPEQLHHLTGRMNLENAPKGICLTTGFFSQERVHSVAGHNHTCRKLISTGLYANDPASVPEKIIGLETGSHNGSGLLGLIRKPAVEFGPEE